MPRLRPKTLSALHTSLGEAAEAWAEPGHEGLRAYGFRHGIAHLIACGRIESAKALVTDFACGMARLEGEGGPGARPLAQDTSALLARHQRADEAFTLWEDFFRGSAHLLERGDAHWGAEKIFLQLAVEHADESPVTKAAEAWLDEGHCDWLWLRRARRPKRASLSACIHVFEGHLTMVTGARLLDDDRLVSWTYGSRDVRPVLRLWDVGNGQPIETLRCRNGPVKDVLALKGNRFVSWADEESLRVWDTRTGKPIASLEGHQARVQGALTLDERILSWSDDTTLRLWDESTARPLATLRGHTASVKGALVLKDRILSWSDDGTLQLWDASTGQHITALKHHSAPVSGVLALEGHRVVSWATDASLCLWNSETWQCTPILSDEITADGNPMRPVVGAMELSNGRFLTWARSGTAHLWSRRDGQHLRRLDAHRCHIVSMLRLTDDRVASCSYDGRICIWSDTTWEMELCLTSHVRPVMGMAELSGGRLVSWGWDGALRVWDYQSGNPLGVLAHQGRVDGGILSPQQELLTWSNQSLALWRTEESTSLDSDFRHTGEVTRLAVNTDSCVAWSDTQSMDDNYHQLAGGSLSQDRVVSTWDIRTGDCTGHLEMKGDPVEGTTQLCSALPDGTFIAVAVDYVWRADYLVHIVRWGDKGRAPSEQSFEWKSNSGWPDFRTLTDGSLVAWSSNADDSSITLRHLDPTTFTPLCEYVGQGAPITEAWEVGTTRILVCFKDHSLGIWDLVSGHMVCELVGHRAAIEAATCLDDGSVLTYSRDGTLRQWSSQSGAELTRSDVAWSDLPIQAFSGLFARHLLIRLKTGALRVWNFDDSHFVELENTSKTTQERLLAHARSLGWETWSGRDALNLRKPWSTCSQDLTGRWTSLGPDLRCGPKTLAARWASEDRFRPAIVHQSGRVFGAGEYECHALELHHGARRVTLDEAAAHLGLDPDTEASG